MKKNYNLLFFITIILFLTNISFAKEIRTRFGFFINLPNDFIAIQDQNIADLMNEYEGSDLDKEFFNEFMAGSTKNDMNIMVFYVSSNIPKNVQSTNEMIPQY